MDPELTIDAQPQTPRRRTGRRTWLLRSLALFFPFGAVALVNALLVWAGVGVDTSLVTSNDRIPKGMSFLNPGCDLLYCNRDLRGPEPRAFDLPKHDKTFRIVVVGASSVQGYPYPSELSFPRHMELLLSRQLSGRDVEVLNAGIVGLGTTPLVDVVSQSFAASPDLIVLYAGHNEFYGIGGVATHAPASRLGIRFRRFRLGQVLTSCFTPDDSARGELITELPSDTAIPIDSPLVTAAEEQYRQNLGAIADACSHRHIPLLMCSVVSNLRDHSPLPSAFPASLGPSDKERLEQLEGQAARRIADQQYTEAVEPLLAAMQLAPHRAETSYRLAMCLDHLERTHEARDCYAKARDLDGCRYRAPDSFHGIAEQVALQGEDRGIHFVDLIPAFNQASERGIPGHDLFLEHVHFTFEGHWLVAMTAARAVVEQICGQSWRADAVPSAEERDQWLGVTNEDHIVAAKLASFLLERTPFNASIDVQNQLRSLTSKMNGYSEALSDEESQLFATLNPKTKIDDLVDGLGRAYLSNGDFGHALACFERGKQRRPWMPNSFVFAAICRHLLGQNDRVTENIEMSYHTPVAETAPLLIERNRLLEQITLSDGPPQ